MKKLIRFILFGVNLLFAVLLLCSTLAGVVEPSRFVWFSLLSYCYVILLVINVLFVLLWLVMVRWECLLSAAVIVARFSFIPLFFQVGGNDEYIAADGDEDLLKVLSLNAHAFLGRDGQMPFQEGAARFFELVRQEQPEIICIQEHNGTVKGCNIADTLKGMGLRYSHSYNGKNHLVLFSRHPLQKVCDMEGSNKFYADIRKNGVAIRLVGVYFSSYHLNEDDLETVDNIAHGQLDDNAQGVVGKFRAAVLSHEREWKADVLPAIENYDGALLLMGDCNDTPASYLYHQMRKYLADAYCEQGGGIGTTYHGPFPAFRIDYQMHNKGLEALSYKRVRCEFSDHYPLIVEYRIKDPSVQ